MTLADAIDAFRRDLAARNLRGSTLRGYRLTLGQFLAFAASREVADIEAVDSGLMRACRESWTCAPGTQRLRLSRLKAFFRFAAAAGWIGESPATAVRAPQQGAPPTMPLTRPEIRSLVMAASERPKERALLLLMRCSGLAIRDAATLARSSLEDGLLTLRRVKSGELVICALPDPVVAALREIARPDRAHFFWTGTSTPATAAKYWRSRLHRVAKEASVGGFKPHRLRDTFAVELLVAGVALQDVSALLGHSSVQTTERYYAPWDTARRDRLVAIVEGVNGTDPLLKELAVDLDPKNKAEVAPTTPANGSAAKFESPKNAESA